MPLSSIIPSQYYSSATQFSIGLFNFPGRTSSGNPTIDLTGPFLQSVRQFNLVDNHSYGLGSHRLKFGLDYRRLTTPSVANAYALFATFVSTTELLAGSTSASNGSVVANTTAIFRFINFSAYGQDTWKISRRLTLNLGVRWDMNPAPTELHGNDLFAVTQINDLATMQLAPRGTPLWKTTYRNFAPRTGLAYQLSQAPGREAVLRGGFGIFYDTGNDRSAQGVAAFPFVATRIQPVSFPISPDQVTPPVVSLTPPYPFYLTYDPSLKLPYTLQWNVALEQAFGGNQVLTLSYVGAAGRNLLQSQQLTLNTINPNFTIIQLGTNKATSDYDAMQVQFQRRLSKGLQALASYTWAHALDSDSTSQTQRVAQRGNADFDVRHVFAAAASYDIPSAGTNRLVNAGLAHWSIDTSFHAQSALPVDIVARTANDSATGSAINIRPDVVLGVPFYVDDPTVPGGRKINRAAFSVPAVGQSGNLGRNQVRALGGWQQDFAIRRQFKLTERLNLQFRAEAFNIFNHPNFGTIQTSLTAANFGQATNMLGRQLGGLNALYQIGGPRSLQMALKLQF